MISERVGDKQASSADTTINDKGTLSSPWLSSLPAMICCHSRSQLLNTVAIQIATDCTALLTG